MAYSARAEVRLMAGGAPLRHAVIQIRRIDDRSGLAQRGVVALMRTDEEGRALGYLSLVRGEGKLELIVIKPGLHGPYTAAENQGAPGAYTPAARLEIDPGDLINGLQLDLDREKGT
jgi:hypothetical protein